MSDARFHINRASDNQYYFNLIAANNEKILTSERYANRASAETGIASVQFNAPLEQRYDRKLTEQGSGATRRSLHYFVLKAANGEILATSEMYPRADLREARIDALKRNVLGARVEG